MVNHRAGAENRSDSGPLRDPVVGWYRGGMSLRAQALEEFDLPAAPQRVDDLPQPAKPATSGLPAPKGFFDDLPDPTSKPAAAPARTAALQYAGVGGAAD